MGVVYNPRKEARAKKRRTPKPPRLVGLFMADYTKYEKTFKGTVYLWEKSWNGTWVNRGAVRGVSKELDID